LDHLSVQLSRLRFVLDESLDPEATLARLELRVAFRAGAVDRRSADVTFCFNARHPRARDEMDEATRDWFRTTIRHVENLDREAARLLSLPPSAGTSSAEPEE
jgi:hypothetical protein